MQCIYENFMMRAEINIRAAQTEKRCQTIKGGVTTNSEDNTASAT